MVGQTASERTGETLVIAEKLKSLKLYKLAHYYSFSFLPKLAIRRDANGSVEAEVRGDKLIIYDKFLKLSKNMQKHILTHELGHAFQNANDISIQDLYDKHFSTFEYEIFDNAIEGFAEGFAVYVNNPQELKSRYPEQFNTMKNWVGPSNTVKTFLKKVLPQLNKLPYYQVFREKDL